jgi:hypothetical protein
VPRLLGDDALGHPGRRQQKSQDRHATSDRPPQRGRARPGRRGASTREPPPER